MAKLSKREAAYREKQKRQHFDGGKILKYEGKPIKREEAADSYELRMGTSFDFTAATSILKQAYDKAFSEYSYSFWWPAEAKTPEELDAYYEGLEELQALEEDDEPAR